MTDVMTTHTASLTRDIGEEMTIDQIEKGFSGEWILMRITEFDEDGCPARGLVLDRAESQDVILDAWEQRGPLLADGKGWPLYSFLAGTLITEGPELQAAVMGFFGGLLQAGVNGDARPR